eukprot:COSAG06_NODE_198_length_20467_cov_97.440986_1_plen_220_part_10
MAASRGSRCFCLAKSRTADRAAVAPAPGGDEMPAHLRGLKLTELKRRALAAGVGEQAVEDAMDRSAPKAALAALLEQRHQGAAGAPQLQALREELATLKLSQLKRQALAAGVSAEAVEAAMDGPSARDGVIALLLDAEAAKPADEPIATGAAQRAAAQEQLRQELGLLGLSALHRRALAAGVQPDAVDEALDAEDGKTPLVELIVQMEHDVPAAAAAEEP